jgi:hypothetical protein
MSLILQISTQIFSIKLSLGRAFSGSREYGTIVRAAIFLRLYRSQSQYQKKSENRADLFRKAITMDQENLI